MKLRNKKTGEIIESACIGVFKHKSSGDCERVDTEARSLEKVLEVWEDCKPSEPLIKDEKIRKAVRAWAELNSIKSVAFEDYDEENIYFIDRDYEPQIWFSKTRIAWELDDGQIYTIDELCGEE